jgi:hypothetical protein
MPERFDSCCRACSADIFKAWFAPLKERPHRDPTKFQRRSEAELEETVQQWEQYVHGRAREFFVDSDKLKTVLRLLALGIDRRDDMVMPENPRECVFWYGELTNDSPQQAAISMQRPDEAGEQNHATYVNRLLAFVFATDECFKKLLEMPKAPFTMICGNQLCVNLNHLSSEA